MSDLLERIKHRRSCRFFNDKLVEKELVDKIVEAGLHAPSGMNKQDSIIIAIQNKEMIDSIRNIKCSLGNRPGDPFYGASTLILVIAKKFPLAKLDGGAVMENMLLEANSLGLGACWIHMTDDEVSHPDFSKTLKDLNIDFNEYEAVGHIVLGYKSSDEVRDKSIKDNRYYYFK